MRPYRSRDLFRFVHQDMRGLCCVCRKSPWEELHHFGDDGGMGLKPSDNEIARLCRACHREHDFKRRALARRDEKNGTHVLEAMQADALEINRVYLERLERLGGGFPRCATCEFSERDSCSARLPHVEPAEGCAMDELAEWLLEREGDLDVKQRAEWLREWSGRRSADALRFLSSVLQAVASRQEGKGVDAESRILAMKLIARRALAVQGIGVDDG